MCLSVCLSQMHPMTPVWLHCRQQRVLCMPRAECVGSFGAAFAKRFWPRVGVNVLCYMPPKRNSKRALWRRNFSFGFNFDNDTYQNWNQNWNSFRDLPVYDPTIFQENCSTRGWVIAIQLFLYLPLYLRCQRHNDTVPSRRPSIGQCSQFISDSPLGSYWPTALMHKAAGPG